jgi:hypothetical protein
MLEDMEKIRSLAFKYTKEQLGRLVQMNMIDPQTAMAAGFARDRIAKEDMKPPTTTVFQDTLGLPAVAQQMPPQMPPQRAPAGPPQMPPQGAPAAPPMMAASGGLTNLPADNVGNYAGGGIVAFAAGSKDPVKEDSGFMFPEGSLAGKFQRNLLPGQESAAARANKELQYIEQRLLDPNISAAERMRLEQGRAVLTQRTNESYPSEGLRGGATFTRPDAASPTFTDARQAPAAAPAASSVEVPSASSKPASLPNIQRPTIDTSTFEEKVAKATPNLPALDKTEAKDVATLQEYINKITNSEKAAVEATIKELEVCKSNNLAIGLNGDTLQPDAFNSFFAARNLNFDPYVRKGITIGESSAYDKNIATLRDYLNKFPK